MINMYLMYVFIKFMVKDHEVINKCDRDRDRDND